MPLNCGKDMVFQQFPHVSYVGKQNFHSQWGRKLFLLLEICSLDVVSNWIGQIEHCFLAVSVPFSCKAKAQEGLFFFNDAGM